jgi:Asp/Glu/hydantoin racemase
LGAVEIVGVCTATAVEVALIRGLQVPVVNTGERRRTECIIAESITRMASTADVDVVVLSP